MDYKKYYGTGNDAFVCERCDARVLPLQNGSFRNHCPQCLWCKHVDIAPGDRAAGCHGLMAPINVEYTAKKGWVITHQCIKCGLKRRNKSAANDPQPDNFALVCKLAANPD